MKSIFETRFKPNAADDQDVDPTQNAHFQTGESLCKTSINEIGQNSRDSKSKSQKKSSLRIYISDTSSNALPADYLPFLSSAIPHILTESSGILNPPDFSKPMKFMVVEDFNTTGLEGDPLLGFFEKPDPNVPNNFYYFWRNVGRSGKTGHELGRFGLGKAIYSVLSKINTFYGLTIRESDRREMLMGQTILKTHNRHDEKMLPFGYKPYGMFGMYDDETYFAKPIEDRDFIQSFKSTFKISRTSESGLSVVVPFVSEDIKAESIAYSFIEQFFFLVLKDELELIVEEGTKKFVINREKISNVLEEIDISEIEEFESAGFKSQKQLGKIIDLAKWVQEREESDHIFLPKIDLYYKPRWNKSIFFSDDNLWDEIKKKFDSGERIALKVPLKYHPVGHEPEICWFELYLEKDPEALRPESIFVRDGLFISGVKSLEKSGVRGMVSISDRCLSKMFGDAENPAHTDWNLEQQDFKDKYNDPRLTIQFLKSSLKQVYQNLLKTPEGLQKDFLVDMFYIPVDKDDTSKSKNPKGEEGGGDETTPDDIPDLSKKIEPLHAKRFFTGVRIYKNRQCTDIPETFTVLFGYKAKNKNPIRKYEYADFDVSSHPIEVESKGIRLIEREKNKIVFQVLNKNDFELNVIGFDFHRDLQCQISPNE